jgi:branched-chain amino acid transport system ATP-binding protein
VLPRITGDRHPGHPGSIKLGDQEILGKPSYSICRNGLAFVPQGRRIFASLTTDEHLRMVARKVGAAQLSGGEQQMLAIGRAVLTNPSLLIMDEPSEGLAPTIVEQLIETCRTLVDEGVTLLLVEQNLAMATSVADRLLVMVPGEVALETTSAQLLADEDMQRRSLGVEPARLDS